MSDNSDIPAHQRVPQHIDLDFAALARPAELDATINAYRGDVSAIVSILEKLYWAIPDDQKAEFSRRFITNAFQAYKGNVEALTKFAMEEIEDLPLHSTPEIYIQWFLDSTKQYRVTKDFSRFLAPHVGKRGRPKDLSILKRDEYIVWLIYLLHKKHNDMSVAYEKVDSILSQCKAWTIEPNNEKLFSQRVHDKYWSVPEKERWLAYPNSFYRDLAARTLDEDVDEVVARVQKMLTQLSEAVTSGKYPV